MSGLKDSFVVQVERFEGPNWKFGNLLTVYVGSGRTHIRVLKTQRPPGRNWEGRGLAQERLEARIVVQHGPNLSQVETNLAPAWTQLEPTWSQLGSMLGPDSLK